MSTGTDLSRSRAQSSSVEDSANVHAKIPFPKADLDNLTSPSVNHVGLALDLTTDQASLQKSLELLGRGQGSPEAIAVLMQTLLLTKDQESQTAAINSLRQVAPDIVPEVLFVKTFDPSEFESGAALSALYELEPELALIRARQLTGSKAAFQRVQAMCVIAEKNPVSAKAIANLLKGDDDPIVRAFAENILESEGPIVSLPQVSLEDDLVLAVSALDLSDERLRQKAILDLASLDCERPEFVFGILVSAFFQTSTLDTSRSIETRHQAWDCIEGYEQKHFGSNTMAERLHGYLFSGPNSRKIPA